MAFLVGLVIGVAFGVVVGTIGFPVSMNWLAHREYRRASEAAEEGPFGRIEVAASDHQLRAPEHAK